MRVLVVEDEAKMAGLIRRGLVGEGMAVDIAARGEDALWRAESTEYDAIVLDVMLPGIDGFEVCRRLRAAGVWAPVMMLTARDSVRDRVAGLDRGADDYLTKPFSFAELLARLRALTRRGAPERPSELSVGDLRLDPAGRRTWRGETEVELSAKEFALLETFMRHPGAGPVALPAPRVGMGLRVREPLEHRRRLREAAAPQARQAVRRRVDRDRARQRLPAPRGRRPSVSRIPLRLRVTIGFAAAMAAILIAAGFFLHVRLDSDLNESINTALRTRSVEVSALVDEAGADGLGAAREQALIEQDETVAEVLDGDGAVVDSTAQLGGHALLSPAQVAAVADGGTFFEVDSVPGLEGRARLLAVPVDAPGGAAS